MGKGPESRAQGTCNRKEPGPLCGCELRNRAETKALTARDEAPKTASARAPDS